MVAKIKDRPMSGTAYEADFSRWLCEQAELIRSGRLSEIDAGNVAEELEGMARSEFRSLKSALRVLILHMLKWDFQPERRSPSWINTIEEQRNEFADVLDENPSLKPRRDEALSKAYRQARLGAARESGLPLDRFPASCPYSLDDVLNRPFDYDSASVRP